ncbi:MAG: adenine phosphoribosyltransferase [Patiriisocius sp.]|jgi:adenine phosphoribosyltransferase
MIQLEDYIRDIHDFPKEGIVFKDITPLLSSPEASQACLDRLLDLVGSQKIDKVVGVEARGFFFGNTLAQELGAGFVPVRKPGKLPFETISETYELEYGTDTLEIHKDAIAKGERVLIHDDVLATGGTARAVCNMVEKMGGIIVQCNFLMELEFLQGAKKIKEYPIAAILHY